MPTFQEFQQFDIRVGPVIAARPHPTSRKPAIQLEIDFGPMGIKHSSAQLTKRYTPETLKGRKVVAVTNFPPRRVADFVSEVLVLGAMLPNDDVVLLMPDSPVADGTAIG